MTDAIDALVSLLDRETSLLSEVSRTYDAYAGRGSSAPTYQNVEKQQELVTLLARTVTNAIDAATPCTCATGEELIVIDP